MGGLTKGLKTVSVKQTGTATMKVMCRVCDDFSCPFVQIGSDITDSAALLTFSDWCSELKLCVDPYTDGSSMGWVWSTGK